MNIEIRHCNNIDVATISLAEKKLNIKFAPNGTGKSTIAKVLAEGGKVDSDLSGLMPFKLLASNPEELKPTVTGLDNIKTALNFNETYVEQFVFQKDELLSDSFNIFIKTDFYKKTEQEIEELVSAVKQIFIQNQDLDPLIETLKDLSRAFKLSKSGITKSCTGMKGLQSGNMIHHIPEGMESYQPFIQSSHSVSWVDWQTKGYVYANLAHECPFCTSPVADKKEHIKKVGQTFDKNIIKNLVSLIEVIDRLGDYFSEETKANLLEITTLKEGIEKEHEDYLVNVKRQIDGFIGKLEKLKTLSGFHFKEGDKVVEKLPDYRINFKFFSALESEKTKQSIEPINRSIDEMMEKAGVLQGKVNSQRCESRKLVSKYQTDINRFLEYAGYQYKVEIAGEGEQSQLKLRHNDHKNFLSGGSQHLSYGERNAFALVLFMYDCLSKKPDLIILDDPISSFDKNKKYAILEMLFRQKENLCLKGDTVLMLTHDVEPIIDTVKSLHRKFRDQTTAAFLKLAGGKIHELNITRNDVQTFAQVCNTALATDKDAILKFIYMRRYFEITDDKGDAYQVLSNLLHKRDTPSDSREPKNEDGEHSRMEDSKFEAGCTQILEKMGTFNYVDSLTKIKDIHTLKTLYKACSNGYEKLQICRLIEQESSDPVIDKFIKETYHIENEFICQLDPVKFDTIPEYVILKCDQIVNSSMP